MKCTAIGSTSRYYTALPQAVSGTVQCPCRGHQYQTVLYTDLDSSIIHQNILIFVVLWGSNSHILEQYSVAVIYTYASSRARQHFPPRQVARYGSTFRIIKEYYQAAFSRDYQQLISLLSHIASDIIIYCPHSLPQAIKYTASQYVRCHPITLHYCAARRYTCHYL